MTAQPGPEPLPEVLRKLGDYSQLPRRLEEKYPALRADAPADTFGVRVRLDAIRHVLAGRPLGRIVDLGGNSGFFSLSLVDEGLAERSVVYDMGKGALLAGQTMARELGLADKVTFVERKLDLAFVRRMDETDTVLCLNLIHHAGAVFDAEEVERQGWQDYAEQWLDQLRRKCRLAILGLGFKASKPAHWEVRAVERPRRFFEMANRLGWRVLYDANVADIHDRGVEPANGLRTRAGALARISRGLSGFQRANGNKARSKMSRYHLYVLERGDPRR